MASLNVLITAGSRRVALVEAFRRAMRELRLSGAIIVTDVNDLSPAVHVADRAYEVSLASEPTYLDEIAEICAFERVGLLIPTIDEELPLFGGSIATFERQGVTVFSSVRQTAERCNDKYAASVVLQDHGVAAATSYLPDTLPPAPAFPLFVKPRRGRGSVGAFPVHDARELTFFLQYVKDPVIQEYLEGPEFTIDVLCDLHGRPISIVPRERLVIRAGVSDRGRTVDDPALIDLGLACTDAFEFRGAVNIQCRQRHGSPTVFEINPRYSGGIPLTIAAGADFPKLMLEMTLGRSVRPAVGQFDAGLYMTSYEATMFMASQAGSLRQRNRRLREAV